MNYAIINRTDTKFAKGQEGRSLTAEQVENTLETWVSEGDELTNYRVARWGSGKIVNAEDFRK